MHSLQFTTRQDTLCYRGLVRRHDEHKAPGLRIVERLPRGGIDAESFAPKRRDLLAVHCIAQIEDPVPFEEDRLSHA